MQLSICTADMIEGAARGELIHPAAVGLEFVTPQARDRNIQIPPEPTCSR
jgi:hypothetical protein